MKTLGISVVAIVVAAVLTGCSAKYPRLDVVDPLPDPVNCRVALLPFVYEGKVPRGENIFFKAFATELRNIAGLEIIPEADITKIYQQMRMYRNDLPNESQMQAIGNRLDAQLIIVGDLVEMEEVDTGAYVDTRMTVSVRIYLADTGKILWNTYHKRKGEEYRNIMHYGRVNTITGLARRVAGEIAALWVDRGMNQCVTQ
ncbi:MAG: hypothetical protein Kow0089_12760 [Desulfobulbaceae bacterium]